MFFFLILKAKSNDLVLSSPRWILTLLSINQSHILEKSIFNVFQFDQYLYVDKQDMNHQHTEGDEF